MVYVGSALLLSVCHAHSTNASMWPQPRAPSHVYVYVCVCMCHVALHMCVVGVGRWYARDIGIRDAHLAAPSHQLACAVMGRTARGMRTAADHAADTSRPVRPCRLHMHMHMHMHMHNCRVMTPWCHAALGPVDGSQQHSSMHMT